MFIDELINALRDENYSLRISAAKALVGFDSELPISAAINALRDCDWWVRYYAIEYLKQFSDRANVRAALLNIVCDRIPLQGIMPQAVETLRIKATYAIGFYNYEIEKILSYYNYFGFMKYTFFKAEGRRQKAEGRRQKFKLLDQKSGMVRYPRAG